MCYKRVLFKLCLELENSIRRILKILLTGGIKLIDVSKLESIQGDWLVENREGASLLQHLIQLQVFQRILLWTYGPLHRMSSYEGYVVKASLH